MPTIIKTEGGTDMLAMISLDDFQPDKFEVFSNKSGSGENAERYDWLAPKLKGNVLLIVHDIDQAGQDGATQSTRKDGTLKYGWGPIMARYAKEVRNVVLPFGEHAGKDLRDWLNLGHTFADLLTLAETAEVVEPAPGEEKPVVNEAFDDPHRLARLNIERYLTEEDATLAYWRNEWFTWKKSRGCYRVIGKDELRAKVTQAIKEQFDSDWQEAFKKYEKWRKSDKYDEAKDKGPPTAKKVSTNLVGSVVGAMAGKVVMSSSIPPMTWIGDSRENKRDYLAFKNGILDIEATLATGIPELIPHTHEWFSTICIPYDFDPDCECPIWEAFLERNLELDPERIKLLQEWAGYLLLPDTGQQKFLVLRGEGSNGKSVFIAGITAMLGMENCAHIPLEMFSDRFQKTETLGKLVNIMPDVGEIDSISEGTIKSFTSGDVMYFDRKGISGVSCIPTARMMLSCNERPRFTDKSNGVWRRMMVVPWEVSIAEEEKKVNMDKHYWWLNNGEASGIMCWAIRGLKRLREQERFTYSAKSAGEVDTYRREMNPTRDFISTFIEEGMPDDGIPSDEIFSTYKKWCESDGHRPASRKFFVRELKRVFKKTERLKLAHLGNRHYFYSFIRWNEASEEIISTDD